MNDPNEQTIQKPLPLSVIDAIASEYGFWRCMCPAPMGRTPYTRGDRSVDFVDTDRLFTEKQAHNEFSARSHCS